jgi:hypothetical protein
VQGVPQQRQVAVPELTGALRLHASKHILNKVFRSVITEENSSFRKMEKPRGADRPLSWSVRM